MAMAIQLLIVGCLWVMLAVIFKGLIKDFIDTIAGTNKKELNGSFFIIRIIIDRNFTGVGEYLMHFLFSFSPGEPLLFFLFLLQPFPFPDSLLLLIISYLICVYSLMMYNDNNY